MHYSSSIGESRSSVMGQIKTRLLFCVSLLIIVLVIDMAVSTYATLKQQSLTMTVNAILIAITLLFSVLVIGILWQTFTRFAISLRQQFAVLEESTIRLRMHDFSIQVPPLKSREFHRLGCALNIIVEAMQQQNTELQERDVLESVLQLNTLLTSTLDLDTLTTTFLAKTLSLLQLEVAALYLYDAEKKHLFLTGAQGTGFTELTQGFALGEGLVGYTAQSRTTFYRQPPDQKEAETFIIKTIQGNVLPSSIYQIPLIQGKQLLGVIVFGSFYPMSEKARNTLNVVSSNLAAVISHTKAYEHIQIQAEILAAKNREQEQTNVALRIQRDELRILNTALEEANQARSQFLSMMAHELRTPLTAILGFSQILLRDIEHRESRSRNNIERILKNGHHLLDLINDALDLVKVEAGHMSVHISQVSLPALINEVVEKTQILGVEKKLLLKTEIAPGINEILSDPDKLRQILLNLVSNALKFTEHGEVCLSARWQTDTEQEGRQIAITIRDSGIGIAPDVQERIFDAFYQGDSSITRKYGGTGLGLAIVRQFTLLLGGTLTLESNPGQGSAFMLLLPQVVDPYVELPNIPIPGRVKVNIGAELEDKELTSPSFISA